MTWAGFVWRNLWRRPARTALTAAGVAIGVGLIVALLSIAAGVRNTASDLIHIGRADFGVFQESASDLTRSLLPESLAEPHRRRRRRRRGGRHLPARDGGGGAGVDARLRLRPRRVPRAPARDRRRPPRHRARRRCSETPAPARSASQPGDTVDGRGPKVPHRRPLPLRQPLRRHRRRPAAHDRPGHRPAARRGDDVRRHGHARPASGRHRKARRERNSRRRGRHRARRRRQGGHLEPPHHRRRLDLLGDGAHRRRHRRPQHDGDVRLRADPGDRHHARRRLAQAADRAAHPQRGERASG